MKRTILYSAVVAMVLILQAQGAQAKSADDICTTAKANNKLITSAAKLSGCATTPSACGDANTILDSAGRNVLCWDSSISPTASLILTAGTQPVSVYGLKIGSTISLTATGNLSFLNLSAPGIKSAITLKDGASIGATSNITCDASYKYEAIDITGKGGSTVDQTNITNCKRGINVMGSDNNILSALTIDSGAVQQSDLVANASAIRLDGKGNIVKDSKLLVQGFDVGISVFNSTVDAYATIQNVSIENPQNVVGSTGINLQSPAKVTGTTVDGYHVAVNVAALASASTVQLSTLGGDIAAIQIAKGMTGMKASQNIFTNLDKTSNTILYVDPDDQKTRRLMGIEFIGKHASDTDANYANRIIGKLLDQQNTSDFIELTIREQMDKPYHYQQDCKVSPAKERIEIKFHKDGVESSKFIEKDEKYFECLFGNDGKLPSLIYLSSIVRFLSNTPAVSTMTENVQASDLGDVPTVNIAGASTISPESGGLADTGSGSGTSNASIPGDVPGPSDTDNGGSNMMGGTVTLSAEAPVTVSGAGADGTGLLGGLAASAGGGCSLTGVVNNLHSQATPFAFILIGLLPLVLTRGKCHAYRKTTRRF